MKTNVQKMELIQEKLKNLKVEQAKIEKELIDIVIQVFKVNEAFQVDFDAMVGGILEAIETIRSDPVKRGAWKMIGIKFCKDNLIRKHRKHDRVEHKMEKNYD